jgi:hypothetical protein
MIGKGTGVGSAGQCARRGMSNARSVGPDRSRPQIAQVDSDVRARGDVIQPQVKDRVGGFNQRVIGNGTIGVGSVLVVREDLRRA